MQRRLILFLSLVLETNKKFFLFKLGNFIGM